ncbi:STAS domain-containing protein [Streptomyces sp. HUAS TT7]|uniref:STAS domain-containing protein n=1 Tax=Streptomyces sp. HUAS TT7 TaxID=3447507 RepID=UPI003F65F731
MMGSASSQPLRIVAVDGLDAVLVQVHGELDVDSAPTLRAALAPWLHRRVELDLTGVTFLDSSGLNALLAHQRHSIQAGGHMVVIHASSFVQRIFALTGVAEYLTEAPEPDRPENTHPEW